MDPTVSQIAQGRIGYHFFLMEIEKVLPTNTTNDIWEIAKQMFLLVSAPTLKESLTSSLKYIYRVSQK